MKGLAILLILLATHSTLGICQSKLGNEWITGGGGQKMKFTGNNIITSNDVFYGTYFTDGNSNICDTNGNLILCSTGFKIYDSIATIIEGGDTLVNHDYYNHFTGWSPYAQTSIFLPMDSNVYYLVTPTYSTALCLGCPFDLLLYNVIDMKANGGAGKVVKRMQPLMQNASLSRTQMMACRHSNGKDWWLLKQGSDSNIVYKFLFTQDSVYDYGKQAFNAPVWGLNDLQGQSVFTRDGSRYASTRQSDGFNGDIFIADFDRCYGILSNPKVVQMPKASKHYPSDTTIMERSPTGVAFSPDGRFLYAIGFSNIFQYDIQDTTWYHVAGLDTVKTHFQDYTSSYLGPNDKLYIGNFGGTSHQMSVIDNPDIKGAGCNFCPRCLRMDTLVNGYAGTPPCMPNYSLGAQECWPLSTHEVKDKRKEIKVYPNPASNQLTIQFPEGTTKAIIILYNILGEAVLTQTNNTIQQSKTELQLGHLANGVYSIHAWVGDTPYISKVVKE